MLRLLLPLLFFTPAPADEKKAEFKLSKDEQALLDLVNAERKQRDLPAYKADPKLFAAARSHAANMAKQNKLEHDLDGKTAADRVAATGFRALGVAENIGWNYQTPRKAVEGWLASDGHRANMLSPEYTLIGLGVTKNAAGEPYWVQVFARPVPE